jgi:peptidoglycan/xylan/chitin deacetylase (PgdA/CDA1 family)
MVQSTHDNGAEAARPAAWSPTPTIWISIGIHAAALLSLASFPTTFPWVLAALAINHLVLGTAGLSPRSNLLGPNVTRLPASSARRREVALTFDDGPDPHATPQVLDLLDRYAAKASFFCVGEKALAHPAIVREIVRRGHSVENHSQHHSSAFAFYGLGALRREILGAQRILAGIAGQAPRFFRAPLGFRNPLVDPVLARSGLRHVAWIRRGCDGVSANPAAVLGRLTRNLAAGDVLMLHDGQSALTPSGQPVVLLVLPALLEQFAAHGLKAVSLPRAFAEEPCDSRFLEADLHSTEPPLATAET